MQAHVHQGAACRMLHACLTQQYLHLLGPYGGTCIDACMLQQAQQHAHMICCALCSSIGSGMPFCSKRSSMRMICSTLCSPILPAVVAGAPATRNAARLAGTL